MAREYLALEKRGATLEELEQVTLGGLRRAVLEGDMEMGSVMSGQVAGMLHEIRPVAEIFQELYEGGTGGAESHCGRMERRGMKLGFLYAGQGSQHAGMGADLYEAYPAFRAVYDQRGGGL